MNTQRLAGLAMVLLSLGSGAAQSQPAVTTAARVQPTDWQQQRQQLAEQRVRQEQLFQSAQAQCYQRFAVTDCLRSARAQHRLAMDELRRQEVILNDLDRQAQAQASLERIGQKLGVDADQPNRAASAP